MTGRSRLLAVVEGQVPDRVPFAINIGQWFGARKAARDLPAELEGCVDEVDAMKALGCDIFSRRCGGFVETLHGHGIERADEPLDGRTTRTTFRTPRGDLTGVSVFCPEIHTTYEREHFWKDYEADYPAIRYLIENTSYRFKEEAWRKADARVGDDGLVIVAAQQTPLKRLINLAGPENALLWCCDEDPRLAELMDIHAEKCLEFAREVAASEAFGMMSMDNLDALFFTPQFFRKFCAPYYRRIGEVLHAQGKFWSAHACGRVGVLRDEVANVRLDGLEGTPHAPLGDIDMARFRDTIPYDRHIVWGGMTCHEQEIVKEPKLRIHEYVKTLFGTLRPFHRFVFSSACNTSTRTSWDNILHFRDACWTHGVN